MATFHLAGHFSQNALRRVDAVNIYCRENVMIRSGSLRSSSRARYLRPAISVAAVLAVFLLGAFVPVSAQAQTGTLSVIYAFTDGADGGEPVGGVIADSAGNLYGETSIGGSASCRLETGKVPSGCGTVYSFSASSGLTVLASFSGPNGAFGNGGLTLVGSTLYGTASAGGASGYGVVFSVHTDGSGFALLHQFTGTDGNNPTGTLRVGPGGILYGITEEGGMSNNGVLFSMTPSGAYTILHNFAGGAKDGASPRTLLISTTGTLVGSTAEGGKSGTIFEYVPSTSKYSVPYIFSPKVGYGGYIGSIGPGPTVYGNDGTAPFSLNVASGLVNLGTFYQYEIGNAFSGPVLSPAGTLIGVEGVGPISIGNLYSVTNGVISLLSFLDYPEAQPTLLPNGNIIGTATMDLKCTDCGYIYEYKP